jgi:hypothetical protein
MEETTEFERIVEMFIDVGYWDQHWQTSYGGVDDPDRRNGYWPADFTPRENPFYVALPYGEFDALGGYELKPDAQESPGTIAVFPLY